MDPDTTLKAIRVLVAAYQTEERLSADEIGELVESIGALDEWISGRGFLPESWRWDA